MLTPKFLWTLGWGGTKGTRFGAPSHLHGLASGVLFSTCIALQPRDQARTLGQTAQGWDCDPSQPWLRCGDVCGGRALARVSWGHHLHPQLRPTVPLPTEPTGAVSRTADGIPAPDWCPPTGRGSSWPLPWGRCPGCMGIWLSSHMPAAWDLGLRGGPEAVGLPLECGHGGEGIAWS